MSIEKRVAEMERLRREATPGEWDCCGANDARCQCRQVWSRSEDVPIFYALRDTDENWTGGKGVTEEQAKNNAAHIVSMQNSQETLLRIARAAEVMRKALKGVRIEIHAKACMDLADALDDFAMGASGSDPEYDVNVDPGDHSTHTCPQDNCPECEDGEAKR